MSEQMPLLRPRDEREQRLLVAVTVGPYVLLALLVIFTVVYKRSAGGSLLIDLILCAAAAAWTLWMFTLHPAWRVRPRVMAVFFTGFIAIMTVLVVRDPWFGFLAPAGYLFAFAVLRWPWRLAGVAAVAVAAGTAQASGVTKTTVLGVAVYIAVLAVNVLPMCGLTWLERNREQQNAQRKQALDEVSEANRKLEATLAENEGLHQQLLAQAREAGVLDERARMAREIHDTLAQGLTGIITQLQAAEQAGQNPAGWHRHVRAATRLARESLSEARRSVDALRPEPLETARLSDALDDIAERWSALHGIAVKVTTTGTERPLAPEAELALLRTAQEALANVARHAHATRVGLTLSYMGDEAVLDVRDDGRGFDPARLSGEANGRATADGADRAGANGTGGQRGTGGDRPAESGFGLVAMRQRIEGLSGTLQVESEPGAGTAISAHVPAAPAEISA
jgi:signal transduction histidine kinase